MKNILIASLLASLAVLSLAIEFGLAEKRFSSLDESIQSPCLDEATKSADECAQCCARTNESGSLIDVGQRLV